MAEFAQVDVKEIESKMSRLDFSEAEIERLANSILETKGMLRPLIVKQTGMESYVVLDGDLEYFAAVRAREKSPQQGEMVNAFVIAKAEESIVQKQIEALRDSGLSATVVSNEATNRDGGSSWIGSFETRLGEIREELFQTKRNHEYRLVQLEKNFEKSKGDLLDFLNTTEKQNLLAELPRYGTKVKIIEAIHDARSKEHGKKFDSYQDVVKATKGFGSSGMLSLIDAWARVNKA